MKRLFYTILFMFVTNVIFSQTGTVVVKVDKIVKLQGKIEVGLYDNEENFPIHDKQFKGASIVPSKSGVTCTFKDIPVGTYAIAVFHDKNEDKIINKNLFGVPKEDYGFSLNKYGVFGPPDFENVSFKVEEGTTKTLTVRLK